MKKKILGIFVCMLLIAIVLPVSGNIIRTDGTSNSVISGITLYVGGSGPGNYSTIQEAIDDASDGDTVFVYDDSSPYYESIVVDKSISLIGEDKDTTTIDIRKEEETAVILDSDLITLTGFTIQNARYYGIQVNGNNCNIISNNIMYNGDDGIRLNSADNLISFNIFRYQDNGIYSMFDWPLLRGGNTIKRNTFSDLTFGIDFYCIGDNSVVQNNFYNNYIDVEFCIERFIWEPRLRNYLFNNYWGEARILPKVIISPGIIAFIPGVFLFIPVLIINVDPRPALKPFVMEV